MYKFITIVNSHIVSDFGFVFLTDFESKSANGNEKLRGNKFKINGAFINQLLNDFESLFIVDARSFGICLLKDLADFDVGLEVLRIKFQYFPEQVNALIGLAKSALDLRKNSHCLEAIFVSRIVSDGLKTGLRRLVIFIVKEHFPEIKLS